MKYFWTLALCLLFIGTTHPIAGTAHPSRDRKGAETLATTAETFPTKTETQLLKDLRCLVCQNQDLADSNATLAKDLRQEVHQLLQQGQSPTEIKAYLQARYGDFILFKPPVKPTTLLLWFGPFLFLSLGLMLLWTLLRK